MALDSHLLLAKDLHEFEGKFLSPMVIKRDQMWEGMKDCITKEAQLQYDTLNDKVRFLEGIVINAKKVISQDAIIVDSAQRLIVAFDKGKAGEISKCLKTLKEITE